MSAVRRLADVPDDDLPEIARALLLAIGEDPGREGLAQTPRRVAESWRFLTKGYDMDAQAVVRDALFEHHGDDAVLVRDIPFYSICEHHLLPFFGRAHIAYVPSGKVIGLSKLSRLVDVFARRLQLQERLTRQVAEAIDKALAPRGVGVVMEARHLCVEMRGVGKINSDTVTSCLLGQVRDDPAMHSHISTMLFGPLRHGARSKGPR